MKTFVGVISIVAFLLSVIVIALAIYLKPEGRYQFVISTPPGVIWILDTRDGTIVDMRSSSVTTRQGKAVKASY